MKRKMYFVGLGLLILGIGGCFLYRKGADLEFFNPLGLGIVEDERKEMRVVGFLPPWNINKTKINTKVLDELIFLGIEADEDGRLVWELQSKKINNLNYIEMKEEMKRAGKKNIVGIKLFDDDKLTTLFENKESVNNLVREIEAVVLAGNFDGVNIDFEYQGDPLAILNDNFFGFLELLREVGVGEIGVDVFCNTVIKGGVEELNRLWQASDYVLIMAYDFTRPGMDYAGPVAPIKAPVGKRSVMETINRAVDLGLDMSKLVAAYPLYGYEWKTETEEFGSRVIDGWYQTASLGRVKELLKENKEIIRNWDELSMTPWLVWKEDGDVRQIYYDDETSLKEKIKLAVETNLGGIGFWALGYEGNSKVWEMVEGEVK